MSVQLRAFSINATFKKLGFLMCAMFFFSTLEAQVVQKEANSELNHKEVKGTFQIEYLQKEGNPVSLSSEFISLLENNRKENELAFIMLDANTRIKIFSRDDLKSGKNISIPEFIVVQSFN